MSVVWTADKLVQVLVEGAKSVGERRKVAALKQLFPDYYRAEPVLVAAK